MNRWCGSVAASEWTWIGVDRLKNSSFVGYCKLDGLQPILLFVWLATISSFMRLVTGMQWFSLLAWHSFVLHLASVVALFLAFQTQTVLMALLIHNASTFVTPYLNQTWINKSLYWHPVDVAILNSRQKWSKLKVFSSFWCLSRRPKQARKFKYIKKQPPDPYLSRKFYKSHPLHLRLHQDIISISSETLMCKRQQFKICHSPIFFKRRRVTFYCIGSRSASSWPSPLFYIYMWASPSDTPSLP